MTDVMRESSLALPRAQLGRIRSLSPHSHAVVFLPHVRHSASTPAACSWQRSARSFPQDRVSGCIQAQWSRDRPRREQASLHSTTDFSASVQTAPFQSFFLFKTDSQTQTPFVSLIIRVIKYLRFSVSSFPIRLKCFQYFKHPKVSLLPSQAPRQTGSQYYLNIINFMIAHRNDCFKLIQS